MRPCNARNVQGIHACLDLLDNQLNGVSLYVQHAYIIVELFLFHVARMSVQIDTDGLEHEV